MNKTDKGFMLVIATYIIMFAAIAYYGLTQGFKDVLDVVYVPGKNPYLFIVNIVVYLAGAYLILTDVDPGRIRDSIDILFFIIPSINIISAFIYMVAAAGSEGIIKFGSEVYFILMYNILLYLVGIIILIREFNIREIPRSIIGYLILLGGYVVYRVVLGVNPYIQALFFLLIIGYTYYALKSLGR